MISLISENLASAIHQQISHEMLNSHLYLYICGFLRNKGLSGLSSHFEKQYLEEINHSKMFFDLLTDLSAPVIIPEVDEVNIQFNNILDISKAYLDREILTTTSINEIKKLAIEEDNSVTEEFMRKMIVIQQNEYEEATDFQDKAELTGGDWKLVFMWNMGLEK